MTNSAKTPDRPIHQLVNPAINQSTNHITPTLPVELIVHIEVSTVYLLVYLILVLPAPADVVLVQGQCLAGHLARLTLEERLLGGNSLKRDVGLKCIELG